MKPEADFGSVLRGLSPRGQSYSGSIRLDRMVSQGRRMTPTPRGPFTELAGLLARGYLRLLAASGQMEGSPGNCKPKESRHKLQNPLDVVPQQRMNGGGKKIDGTT